MPRATIHLERGRRARSRWRSRWPSLDRWRWRRGAQALPASFWGVVPQATPSAEQFQRLKRGGVDSVRIPLVWGAVQPTRADRFDWAGLDGVVDSRGRPGSRCCPSSTGAPGWAVPQAIGPGSRQQQGADAPAGQGAAASAAGRPSLSEAVAATGRTAASGPHNPACRERPIRDLADLERAELQVLRRQAQPGRIREAGQALLRGAEGAPTPAPSHPRRPLRRARRRPNCNRKPPQRLLRHRLPRTDVQDDAGDQGEVQRRRPASLHLRPTSNSTRRSKKSATS